MELINAKEAAMAAKCYTEMADPKTVKSVLCLIDEDIRISSANGCYSLEFSFDAVEPKTEYSNSPLVVKAVSEILTKNGYVVTPLPTPRTSPRYKINISWGNGEING